MLYYLGSHRWLWGGGVARHSSRFGSLRQLDSRGGERDKPPNVIPILLVLWPSPGAYLPIGSVPPRPGQLPLLALALLCAVVERALGRASRGYGGAAGRWSFQHLLGGVFLIPR